MVNKGSRFSVVVLDRDDVVGVDEDHLVLARQLQVDDRDRAAADSDDFFVGFLGADLDLELTFVGGVDDCHGCLIPGPGWVERGGWGTEGA